MLPDKKRDDTIHAVLMEETDPSQTGRRRVSRVGSFRRNPKGSLQSLLGTRTLLGAPGFTTRKKQLLGAKGASSMSANSNELFWETVLSVSTHWMNRIHRLELVAFAGWSTASVFSLVNSWLGSAMLILNSIEVPMAKIKAFALT